MNILTVRPTHDDMVEVRLTAPDANSRFTVPTIHHVEHLVSQADEVIVQDESGDMEIRRFRSPITMKELQRWI